ncbi:radical SAM protein [Antribacter sp. KLBMP9083]|uniref:Radical SAM protein n=1 Tax=Antribacter soli TaxID=2910976 RepID=A0AA41QD51_9MICO|nr:cyclophane-forming radical SAM peptide maturase AmcB [Antribacter soli]MCF4119964.1 radical SAM protein [Antribacter soli]
MTRTNAGERDAADRFEQWVAPRASLVVLQPTTLCNLDCSYCYLPFRRKRQEMSVEVAEAVAASLADVPPTHTTEVCWHGGEPLAAGPEKLAALMEPFEDLRRAGRVRHSLQTNATLINDTWCDLLIEHEVSVGVSIDGPGDLNAERTDWSGRPAFDRIVAGIGTLAGRGIAFSLIAVVGAGIGRAAKLLDFLSSLGPTSIGLNIEEFEGVNAERTQPTPEQARTFWTDVLTWSAAHPGVEVRELDRLGHYLRSIRTGGRQWWESHRFDPLPTVAFSGDVVLLSPELAGIRNEHYGDFLAGNVLEQSLDDILDGAHRLRYVSEFLDGLEACRATCGFFDFCRGAQAGNRYFENGRFDTTETNFCRVSKQELVHALIDITQKEQKT